MKTSELRKNFLDFYAKHDHTVVSGQSLIPDNDPTLMFVAAGMVQFKDVFLGIEKRDYVRATTAQRCLRAGGKHNDLENVGYNGRHLTFFEMLGNFSFGDYFKEDAIKFAWEFLTQVLKIEPEKLWVTVHEDDKEAENVWLNIVGIDPARFSRLGKDNFWEMGDTGPCGPSTEIFYDHGEDVPGGPPGSPDEDGDRYVEIFNNVFMQYETQSDGTRVNLPKPSVDTGMGLERTVAVLQGVHSIYETDLFVALIDTIASATHTKDKTDNGLKVIADHIRACSFLIADGILPSNEGRGYVLRRIIRRAVRHGFQLGQTKPFFHTLVDTLIELMGEAYPVLTQRREKIVSTLKDEELKFAETIERGMSLLESAIKDLNGKVIGGDTVFKLYDTYGFPVDLTADIAREQGLSIDEQSFEVCMDAQRARSREQSKFGVDMTKAIKTDVSTTFTGYDTLQGEASVKALFKGEQAVDALTQGEEGVLLVNETPFYAESGGQVGDVGNITVGGTTFNVLDTQKIGNAIGHIGRVASGTLKLGDQVALSVDAPTRAATVRNHSTAHLLNAALREILGDHVEQRGSSVGPDALRFDFSHAKQVTPDELKQIEQWVNREIQSNAEGKTNVMAFDDAIKAGALAFFEEKYGDEVRVLKLGDSSTELCGGTHVSRLGDIGLFKITEESSIASGVRRIVGVTGQGALNWINDNQQVLSELTSLFQVSREQVAPRVQDLIEKNRELERELQTLHAKQVAARADSLLDHVVHVQGLDVLAARLDGVEAKDLREAVDRFKQKLGNKAVVVLGAANDNKVHLVAGVAKGAMDRVSAGELVKHLAEIVGGKGGGRADMAQAGGSDPSQLDAALAQVNDWVTKVLAA